MISNGDRDMYASGIAFAASPGGHRESYIQLFAKMFALSPLMSDGDSVTSELRNAPRLLFATLDDHVGLFARVAVWRALRGRRTVGMFLRPQSCFDASARSRVKRLLFATLKRAPGVSIFTIVPFAAAPHYAKIATGGLYDPQWWDQLQNDVMARPPQTALSAELAVRAAGRPILAWLGQPAAHKGFDFFIRTILDNPDLMRHICPVVAGPAGPYADAMKQLRDVGVVHIDRRIGDQEWESIYGVARVIWACFPPAYDQSSGTFGRSYQFGVRALIRRGSEIERLCDTHDIGGKLAVDYEDAAQAAAVLLTACDVDLLADNERDIRISGWRRDFEASVSAALLDERSSINGDRS